MKYALFLLPAIGCLLVFQWKIDQLQDIETAIYTLEKKALTTTDQKTKNEHCLTQLKTADPAYLKQLETLTLLESEVRRVQALLSHQKENYALSSRLEFLKSEKNHLAFIPEKQRSNGELKESEEKLQHPVEMDEEDLKKLLVLVEGVLPNPYIPIQGMPQLVFKEFELTKQMAPSEEEIYRVDFKLIKREAK